MGDKDQTRAIQLLLGPQGLWLPERVVADVDVAGGVHRHRPGGSLRPNDSGYREGVGTVVPGGLGGSRFGVPVGLQQS